MDNLSDNPWFTTAKKITSRHQHIRMAAFTPSNPFPYRQSAGLSTASWSVAIEPCPSVCRRRRPYNELWPCKHLFPFCQPLRLRFAAQVNPPGWMSTTASSMCGCTRGRYALTWFWYGGWRREGFLPLATKTLYCPDSNSYGVTGTSGLVLTKACRLIKNVQYPEKLVR